jgi:hypothetical protein
MQNIFGGVNTSSTFVTIGIMYNIKVCAVALPVIEKSCMETRCVCRQYLNEVTDPFLTKFLGDDD